MCEKNVRHIGAYRNIHFYINEKNTMQMRRIALRERERV